MPIKLNPTTFRPNADDLRLMEKLKRAYGITSAAELWRMGLRALDRELNAIPQALALAESKRKPKA